jgi:hypothetical protein
MYIQSLHPTLINSSSYLNVVSNKNGKLVIKVLDIQGRIAKRVTTSVAQGNQQLSINMSDLNSGMYILNAFNGDTFIKSIRFVKQ